MRFRRFAILLWMTLALGATSIASSRPPEEDRSNRQRHERVERQRAEHQHVERQRAERPDNSHRVARPRAHVSLDRAVVMAERRFHARVVRADSRQESDRAVYVLRLLNDSGRVWTVRVDSNGATY